MWFGNHSEPLVNKFAVYFVSSTRKASEEEWSYLSVVTARRFAA